MKRKLLIIFLIGSLLLSACAWFAKNAEPDTAIKWQEQYDLGIRYLSEGNYEEAILAFTAAIEIDPKQPETYISLSELYIDLGDTESAIAVLKQGFEATGDEALRDLLEKWELEQKMTEEARTVFAWYYKTMQSKDYKSIARLKATGCDFNPVPIDFFKNNPDYIDLCYDGMAYSTDLDGVGLKIINENFVYYGDLAAGVPTGQGACVDIRSVDASDAALELALYIGAWSNGLPNGAGTRYLAYNYEGEQGLASYEGHWVKGLADGEFVHRIEDALPWKQEFHYAFEQGQMVLDGRWSLDRNGSYFISSVLNDEHHHCGLCYDPTWVLYFLNNGEA